MNDSDILERVTAIIRSRFAFTGPVTGSTVATDIDGWDSIAHVDLILIIEEEFDIRLTTGETANLPDVGALVSAVSRRLARKGS